MTITYVYGKNLYINLTNRCPNACEFCLRSTGDHVGDSGSLWLEREPAKEEILADLKKRDLSQYAQLVYCGFGEPTYRLKDIKWISANVRKISSIPIRINTNGLSDLLFGRDTAPDFAGITDAVSISLNASTPEKYDAVCHSEFGLQALPAILTFAKRVKQYVPTVIMTVVDTLPADELEACRRLCADAGAEFHVRTYSEDWTG